jgi:hypothetical protein
MVGGRFLEKKNNDNKEMIVIVVQSSTGITILVLLLDIPSLTKSSSSKIEDILLFLQRHFLH